MSVTFLGLSRHDSANVLIAATTGGTARANLRGLARPLPDSDGDGIHYYLEDFIGDGNCDGVPDAEQSNVASFLDGSMAPVTIVAPTDPIGAAGDFYPAGVIPRLFDVTAIPPPDEGGGPVADSYPVSFIGFSITTNRAHLYAGNSFPISIILPSDASAVDGYVKCGPVPDDFPPSLVHEGCYDFVYGWRSGTYPWFGVVGAVVGFYQN